MVAETFNIYKDSSSNTGWTIESISDPTITFDMPENVYNSFDGKYISADELLEKIKTIRIALAGVTDSLNIVNREALIHNSVTKTFTIKDGICNVDDMLDFVITVDNADDGNGIAAMEYEKWHIIKMERDVLGDDDTIHAYVTTPKDGKLRCRFSKDVRLDAKRNNIKYWADDYKIQTGTNGGKYVIIDDYHAC